MARDDKFGAFTIRNEPRNREIGEKQLIKLYRNRAELKKEFKRLRDERYTLEQQLEKKDNELQKSRGKLTAFEALLAEPTTAFKTLVFFQLRGIWEDCSGRVKKLVLEMTQMRETRERQLHVADFSKVQGVRAGKFKVKESALQAEQEEFSEIIEKLRKNCDELKGFWNFFKRRDFRAQISENETQRQELKQKSSRLAQKRQDIEAEQPPEFGGLSVQGRRAINLVGLASAHHLYEHYASGGLYKLVKAATVGRPRNARYGDKAACEKIMKRVNELKVGLGKQKNFNQVLREETERIKSVVSYRKDADCIPLAKSLTKLPSRKAQGDGKLLESVNLLADQVWDVHDAMLN
ncbi:MAG: hypothetical protein IIA98_08390 [Proteobacteria bacterium]|nr:hypothetical protein [Pseudomonadota bacterium]